MTLLVIHDFAEDGWAAERDDGQRFIVRGR